MSRMATMQVLNQAFNNLNHAMNNYTQNQNMARRTDLMAKEQELEELWRKRNFDAAQAQLGWNNERTIRQDAQNQSNLDRQFNFSMGQYTQALEQQKAQENAAMLRELSAMAEKFGVNVANAWDRARRGDPIARNMLIAGIEEADKRAKLAKQYDALLAHERALELIKARKGDIEPEAEDDGNNLIENLTKGLSSLDKSLNSWYWTDSGRKDDEEKRNRIQYQLANKIKSVAELKRLTQSGVISAGNAQQIAKINGWIQ